MKRSKIEVCQPIISTEVQSTRGSINFVPADIMKEEAAKINSLRSLSNPLEEFLQQPLRFRLQQIQIFLEEELHRH